MIGDPKYCQRGIETKAGTHRRRFVAGSFGIVGGLFSLTQLWLFVELTSSMPSDQTYMVEAFTSTYGIWALLQLAVCVGALVIFFVGNRLHKELSPSDTPQPVNQAAADYGELVRS